MQASSIRESCMAINSEWLQMFITSDLGILYDWHSAKVRHDGNVRMIWRRAIWIS